MKKLACIVFELDEKESVENVIKNIEAAYNNCTVVSRNLNDTSENSWEERLKNILTELKMKSTLKGYTMIWYAMEAISKNPQYIYGFKLKDLYKYITDKTGIKWTNIDHSIRTSIFNMHRYNSDEDIKNVLTVSDEYVNTVMSVSQFMDALSKVVFK